MKGRAVAAHCHGEVAIQSAIRHGVLTIEHGTWLTRELAGQMKANNCILVPTLLVLRRLLEVGAKMGASKDNLDKLTLVTQQHAQAMKLAIECDVKIAMGTDIFSSAGPDSAVPWGSHAKELEYLVAAGMTPIKALHAATGMGPLTLGTGRRVPRSGMLMVGCDADILALRECPLPDVRVLQLPANILGVFKDGLLMVDRTTKVSI